MTRCRPAAMNRWRGPRAAAAIGAAIAAGLIGVSSAVSFPAPSGVMVSNPPPSHGLWTIVVSGTNSADSIDVGFVDGRYVISSPDGVDFYDSAVPRCESESATEVRCTLPSSRRVRVLLNGANDHLDLSGPVRTTSYGARGSDTIEGSPVHNALVGEAGNDRLAGEGGRDLLVAGGGGDSLAGNAGDDRLFAVDGEKDATIDCGPGLDKAFVDRGQIDPDPLRCERIIHKADRFRGRAPRQTR